jgi:5'-3' exonuclease
MGIPFYVASLIRKHKEIQKNVKEIVEVDVLGIDFNCFIHTYLKPENPIGSIVLALDDLFTNVVRAKRVLIAFDGLVPFAKIVQQRYRRFKKPEGAQEFDKHQISPGTPFMKNLEEALLLCFPHCKISSTQEPGEGEHKIFTWLRTEVPEEERKTICIYGLDADLVLISIAQHELGSIHLLREKEGGFGLLLINKLISVLPLKWDEYVIMSVLCFGNDFMPPLAMFSLREDGYGRALHYFSKKDLIAAAKDERDILMKRKKDTDVHIVSRDGHAIEARMGVHLMDGVLDWERVAYAFWKTYEWTLHYFMYSEVLDWCWYYPYPEAPLLSTLNDFDLLKKEDFDWENPVPPYTIEDQLKFILPVSSLERANETAEYPDEIYDENSEDMRHMWMKQFKWECDPFISMPWNPLCKPTTVEFIDGNANRSQS